MCRVNNIIKIKKMKTKKAQGHIEMILSFVIFLGFLIFIFVFFNPFASFAHKPEVMNNVENKLIANISQEVGKISMVFPNIPQTAECFNIDTILSPYSSLKKRFVQEDSKKYTIYFSNLFDELNCPSTIDHYELGVYSTENLIFKNLIVTLKQHYEADYEKTRISLGILYDFSFKVKDLNGNEIPELSVDKQVLVKDVEAKNIPIRLINEKAEIQELILNIRAW